MQRNPRRDDNNVRGTGGFHCSSARTALIELLEANPPLTSHTNTVLGLVAPL